MKTRPALFLLLLLPGLLTPAWAEAQKGQPIQTTGTIKRQGIEGGFWGIVGDDGQNYDPANLAPEFQKEGLRVSFEAVTKPDAASFHMWGTIVEIKSIKKLGRTGVAVTVIKTTGTIKHQRFDDGFWGIIGDDGKNYRPRNLAPEFKKEDLRVYFEAEIIPVSIPSGIVYDTVPRWGIPVEIKSIKKLGRTGTTGVAQADLAATWEGAKRVLAARGESLVVRDETTETIATKPHALDRDALLAAFTSRIKPEDSGYRNGTYELAITLTAQGKKKTMVEVKAKIMAFGTENKAMAKPDTWDPVPSNGKIEREVLKAIQAEAKKKK